MKTLRTFEAQIEMVKSFRHESCLNMDVKNDHEKTTTASTTHSCHHF
jgi:hypothetical protein